MGCVLQRGAEGIDVGALDSEWGGASEVRGGED